MNSGQALRAQIIDIISEEIGILAEVVFDEVLEDLGIPDSNLSPHLAGKFIRLLNGKLPDNMSNRQHVIHEVGRLLIESRRRR